MASRRRGYWWCLFLALDRLLNAVCGGDDRELVSERVRKSNSWMARHVWRHFALDPRERQPRAWRRVYVPPFAIDVVRASSTPVGVFTLSPEQVRELVEDGKTWVPLEGEVVVRVKTTYAGGQAMDVGRC